MLADDWACMVDGRCRTVALTPEGARQINDHGLGDLGYFPPPRGHGHSMRTVGEPPCQFLLAYDDGEGHWTPHPSLHRLGERDAGGSAPADPAFRRAHRWLPPIRYEVCIQA